MLNKYGRPARLCDVEGCDERHFAKGYCRAHWRQARENLTLDADPCSVEGCDRGCYAKKLCSKHYLRLQRLGTTTLPVKPTVTCRAAGCVEVGRLSGFCTNHYTTDYYQRRATERRPVNPDSPISKEMVGYIQAHVRVMLARGKASEYDCELCGGRAQEWARSPDATNLVTEPRHGRDGVYIYSLDVWDYLPWCKECHRAQDAIERGGVYNKGSN